MLTSPGFSLTCITEFHTRIRAVLQASGRTDVRWRLCPTGNRTLVELGLRPDSVRSPKMCLQAPPEGRRRRRPSAHQPAKQISSGTILFFHRLTSKQLVEISLEY